MENKAASAITPEEKTRIMVEAIAGQYTAKDWATCAIFGVDLTTEQIVEAESNVPFVHRDALRDAIMRESGKYVTSYDAAQSILAEGVVR